MTYPYYFKDNCKFKYLEGRVYSSKIADMVVLDTSLESLFKYHYEIGENSLANYCVLNEGLHSYSEKECNTKVIPASDDSILPSYVVVYQKKGDVEICSYPLKHTEYHNGCIGHFDIAIARCHIPKGSTYYENEKGEIVSNKLFVDSIEYPS